MDIRSTMEFLYNAPGYCKFENFREGFILAKLRINFVKIKPLRNREITLSSTDKGKTCPSHELFGVANMSFKAIHEN